MKLKLILAAVLSAALLTSCEVTVIQDGESSVYKFDDFVTDTDNYEDDDSEDIVKDSEETEEKSDSDEEKSEEENESEDKKVESPVTTFNLNEQASSAPAWIAALRNTQNNRK